MHALTRGTEGGERKSRGTAHPVLQTDSSKHCLNCARQTRRYSVNKRELAESPEISPHLKRRSFGRVKDHEPRNASADSSRERERKEERESESAVRGRREARERMNGRTVYNRDDVIRDCAFRWIYV